MVTLLTKSGGLLGPIDSLLGMIMNGIFEFFNLFGIQNIALSIFIFTFIIRALMLPITIKQQKFTKLSSKMNPELQKIQAKYKGKKDEVSLRKQNEETQALYQKYGANPTSGCLPLLITLPIMFSLYNVINNIPAYVNKIKEMYVTVATQIQGVSGSPEIIKALAEGNSRIKGSDFSTTDQIINALSQFGSEKWHTLASQIPSLTDTINASYNNISNANDFIGLNIANTPGWGFPGLLIPILAGVLSFVQSKQIQVKTQDSNKDNPAASAMNSMIVVMPIMQFFFCVTFPIGIGIYWISTSLITIIQQYFVNKVLDRVDVDDLIAKNVAKASKRKAKLAASGISLEELAKKQTKSIVSSVPVKENGTDNSDINDNQEVTDANEDTYTDSNKVSNGPKSISEIANLLKNRN